MKVSDPGAIRGKQRLGGHGAHHVGGRREHLGVVKREAPDRGHDRRPIDKRDAFLRAELDGLEARRLQRVGPTPALALVDRLALTDQHERRVREWREVPGCADAAVPRYRGVHAPIDHVAEKVDDPARTPDRPAASVLARSTRTARTTSSGSGGPTPT